MRNYLAAIAVAGTALTATAAQAVPAFSFLIDGDTFSIPFQITNNSTDGESILKFGIDLAGAGADY